MGGQRDLELTMRRYALRDDQWDRIKDLLPGREGPVGVTAKDNRLFVEPCCIVIGPAFHGGTCPSGLAIRKRSTRGLADGRRAGFGRGFLTTCRTTRTTNTR